jgi:hypothetical protein
MLIVFSGGMRAGHAAQVSGQPNLVYSSANFLLEFEISILSIYSPTYTFLHDFLRAFLHAFLHTFLLN